MPSPSTRILSVVLGVAALVAAGFIALHHPLSPAAVLAATLVAAVLAAVWPAAWPAWVLPLWPLASAMPWTGWIVVEEFDLLVLAVVAGFCARWAWRPPAAEPPPGPSDNRAARQGHGGRTAHRLPRVPAAVSHRPWALIWAFPLVLAGAVAAVRGLADSGGWSAGAGPAGWWWQAYREPLNALRQFKPLLLVLLLLALWVRAWRWWPRASAQALGTGMFGLLAVTAAAVCSERIAYTGLLNFSSDYRASGPFWEMHVGGVALDAALVLSFPFGWAALEKARTPRRWLWAALVVAMAAYAALATFSRIVYAAVPLTMLIWLVLWRMQRRRSGTARPMAWAAVVMWSAGGIGLAMAVFPGGGYRALLAVLGALALTLTVPAVLRDLPRRVWVTGLAGGILATLLVMLVAAALPKGPYIAYAAAWSAAAACIAVRRLTAPSSLGAAVGLITSGLAVLLAIPQVAVGWGGPAAATGSIAATCALCAAVALGASGRCPRWPDDLRWQGGLWVVVAVGSALVGVLGGGVYMEGRFATALLDAERRGNHFSQALAVLRGDEWPWGIGSGRFPDRFAFSRPASERVGDHRIVAIADRAVDTVVRTQEQQGGRLALSLAAGGHVQGWGELYRVSQRIAVPAPGPLTLRVDVRAERPAELHADLCEKHLLYGQACATGKLAVEPSPQGWRTVSMRLAGHTIEHSPPWAPRWVVLSLAVSSPGQRLLLDRVSLRDVSGRELLVNGSFEQGMARWFFTSDLYHRPWQVQNLAVHLWVEQGAFGLMSWALALGAALWRLSLGAARAHPLAPALAAALAGVLVVGLADSVIQAVRVAWLLALLLVAALTLPRLTAAGD